MKRTLIALAVLGAAATTAQAQTHVTIYGTVDTGFVKSTGQDTYMGSNEDSRIGFRGTEDLGGGNKATFQLERRLNLNNGSQGDAYNWNDVAAGNDADWQEIGRAHV